MSDFDERVKRLENEITRLKTSKTKSAGALKIKEVVSNISLSLKLDTLVGGVYSSKKAVVTLNSSDGGEFLSSLTLNASSLEDRSWALIRRYSGSGVVEFVLAITNGNASDWQTLYGGGSVTVNMGINIRATRDFSVSIAYEDQT